MSTNGKVTLVIRNGTLIDGMGNPATANDAIVIEGNRISSVGPLPGEVKLEDREHVEVVDASGKWVMPGLIDGHCHLSFGNPKMAHPPKWCKSAPGARPVPSSTPSGPRGTPRRC